MYHDSTHEINLFNKLNHAMSFFIIKAMLRILQILYTYVTNDIKLI